MTAQKKTSHSERVSSTSYEILPPTPPDGGWGWVVVVAALICSVIVDGVCFSFGVFLIRFLEEFKESKSRTAWAGSLVPGMYLSIGPVASALANKFSCRNVTIFGSVMAAVFYFLSAFSPDLNILILTYGVLGGIGFGFMYLPSIVIVGYYFEKKRALATGLAVCGSGIGAFIFAPLSEWLLDEYGWRGSMWIIAAICLHGVACGAVFRPLLPTKRVKETGQSENTIMLRIIEEKNKQRKESTGSMNGAILTRDNRLVRDQDTASRRSSAIPSLAAVPESATLSSSPSNKKLSNSVSNSTDGVYQSGLINKHLERVKDGPSRPRTDSTASKDTAARARTGSVISSGSSKSRKKELTEEEKKIKEMSRPMVRKDIFYSGSIKNLPEYKENPNRDSYIQSVTTIPQETGHVSPALQVFKDMLDFSLLKSPMFCFICAASFLAMMGFFIPFVYCTDYALEYGIDKSPAMFLISILGICNTVGRILTGFISDLKGVDALLIHNLALIFAGAATACVPLLKNYPLLVAYCCIFGFCVAAYISLRSIMLVELLGIEKLTKSFGLMLLFQGLASIVGSPLAGMMYDMTKSYTIPFVFSGLLISLAGVLCLPLRWIKRWEDSRNAKKNPIYKPVSQTDKVKVVVSDY